MCFKFALNAAYDTLPHNSNIRLWKKKSVTLVPFARRLAKTSFVLNYSTALNLRRYNKWHDEVLSAIAQFVREHLPAETKLSVDIEDQHQIPDHIMVTALHPDLLWWNNHAQTIVIAEQTCCFESSFELSVNRKTTKYIDLIDQAPLAGYSAMLVVYVTCFLSTFSGHLLHGRLY